MKNYANIIRFLNILLKKRSEFSFLKEYLYMFEYVKEAIFLNLVLKIPNLKKLFKVEIDILGWVIGG